MAGKNISMAVIRRLPKYYRYLGDLLDNDVQRISSKELSEIIGFTASQIRQDLNNLRSNNLIDVIVYPNFINIDGKIKYIK